MAPTWYVEEGLLKGLEFSLALQEGEEWAVGRDPKVCRLVIADPEVAPLHAFLRSVKGKYELRAAAPLFVNGVLSEGNLPLSDNDTIRFGATLLRCSFGESGEGGSRTELEREKLLAARNSWSDLLSQEQSSLMIGEKGRPLAPEEDETIKRVVDQIFEESKEEGDMLAEVNFDLVETGRWLLKVIGGPNNGAEFFLQAGSSYLIGTDPNSCDVIFHDTSVSRQHARLKISDEETLVIEDLGSRNGTIVDGKKIAEREALVPNTIVTLGTTSFVVLDREGEMQTVISPMLPSIVKVLQKEETTALAEEKNTAAAKAAEELPPIPEVHKGTVVGTFVLTAAVTGILVVVGLGTLALFRGEPMKFEQTQDAEKQLVNTIEKPFPGLKYSFTPSTGNLLLVGHVLTQTDKQQLINSLQSVPFVTKLDDKVIVDELVTREINPILTRNPAWRRITIQTPKPGQFVLTGQLATREEADRLIEYINANFSNLDNLQRQILVEEEVIRSAEQLLQKLGFRDVKVQMIGDELSLSGAVPSGHETEFKAAAEEIRALPGVRNVKISASVLPPEATLVNLTGRYQVSGVSSRGGVSTTIVINGRILTRGDMLDGMTITTIRPNAILLEKEGVKYRIDY